MVVTDIPEMHGQWISILNHCVFHVTMFGRIDKTVHKFLFFFKHFVTMLTRCSKCKYNVNICDWTFYTRKNKVQPYLGLKLTTFTLLKIVNRQPHAGLETSTVFGGRGILIYTCSARRISFEIA